MSASPFEMRKLHLLAVDMAAGQATSVRTLFSDAPTRRGERLPEYENEEEMVMKQLRTMLESEVPA